MSLKLYNSLGNKKEEFIPIKENEVGLYGCGPTVYNYAHIGNLRTYVFEDILVKFLEFLNYNVKHVMNITDVGHLTDDGDDGEDKMLKTAKERNKSVLEIAEFYTKAFFTDVERLNIKRPSIICKATEHIDDMIELIKRLEKKGHTYFSGGNLYYDISTFPKYRELANINLEDLKAGARVEIDKNKKNPHDFVLWFTKSKFENHALNWDSPWGRGYPGWHLECSAMSMKYLGEQFDIHKGGIDHIRVHHTNEIAQSEGATGKKWVKYWLHNEFLIMEKDKMSKSAGSFIVLDDILKEGFAALDYRFLLLGGHYRNQLTFSWEAMESAKNGRKKLNTRISKLLAQIDDDEKKKLSQYSGLKKDKVIALLKGTKAMVYFEKFIIEMEDDLSTPRAISHIQSLVKDKNIQPIEVLIVISVVDSVFGLKLIEEADKILHKKENTTDSTTNIDESEINKMIKERAEAKMEKNYKVADEIRNKLKEMGITLEDKADKTTWKKA